MPNRMSKRQQSKKGPKKGKWNQRKARIGHGKILPWTSTFRGPTDTVVKLRYNETFRMVSTGGVLSEYLYRANSMYDPNYTSTGHQSFGFDTLATMYNHYSVISAKITVLLTPEIYNPGIAVACGVYCGDDSTAYGDFQTYREARRGTSVIVPMSAGGIKPQRITSLFNASRFFSKDRDRGDTTATVNANPAEEAIWHIYMQTVDKASTSNYITFNVTIDSVVRFYEPKDLPSS